MNSTVQDWKRRGDYFYVTRRSDGYVSVMNGYRPGRYAGSYTFEPIAEGADWTAMRAVVLVERGELRVDEAGRYRLRLTEQRRPVLGGDRPAPVVREWEADGAGLRELLWQCAAGRMEGLPERSYFDRAGYEGTTFRLEGVCSPGSDLLVEVIPAGGPRPAVPAVEEGGVRLPGELGAYLLASELNDDNEGDDAVRAALEAARSRAGEGGSVWVVRADRPVLRDTGRVLRAVAAQMGAGVVAESEAGVGRAVVRAVAERFVRASV
ncbi:hypothetical protein [Streptomyces albogriseolus]|uniref:hypothetical protein n=1 Tax=Streptomyces albogriseolus TaxID=1887 RepID=UPI00345F7FA4